MAMRRPARAPARRFEPAGDGWSPEEVAVLRHVTLPWSGVPRGRAIEGVPLETALRWGERDRLAILAQMAGHLAFLRDAGSRVGRFAADEWLVHRARGEECRVIRGWRRGEEDATAGYFLNGAAELLQVGGLETLTASWVKPDAVWIEIDRRLRSAASGTRWHRRAAAGAVATPGIAAAARIATGEPVRLWGDDHALLAAGEALGAGTGRAVIRLGGPHATPLRPFSGVTSIVSNEEMSPGREAEICEALERRLSEGGTIVLVRDPDCLDPSSLRLIRLLASSRRDLIWLGVGGRPPLPDALPAAPTRSFFVCQRLQPQVALRELVDAIPSGERDGWMEAFTASEAFDAFIEADALPVVRPSAIGEPRRSYLAALAVAGDDLAAAVATRLLRTIGWTGELRGLATEGIVDVDEERIRFISEGVRRAAEAAIPPGARPALCRLAAEIVEASDGWRALLLRLESGDDEAVAAIETHQPYDDRRRGELLESIARMPAERRVSPAIARLQATALLREGRYRTAIEVAGCAAEPHRTLIRAAAERRLGRYGAALRRLDELLARETPPGEALLLAAELHRLEGRHEVAGGLIDRAARTAGARSAIAQQIAYERAVLAIDAGTPLSSRTSLGRGASPYHRARLATYLAVRTAQYAVARKEAGRALALAADPAERIDASLDLLFTLFLAGEWSAARLHARETLALVEETDGDRAAGGVLFTLAYLCADAGEWDRAEDMLARLRAFYTHTGDAFRLDETRLLAAHLAFSRGRLAEARASVAALDLPSLSPEEREAALLVLDEADLLEGEPSALRSTGGSGCRELSDRHRLLDARLRRVAGDGIANPFLAALSRWEAEVNAGREAEPPPAESGAERLALFRAIRTAARRTGSPDLSSRAVALASRLGIELGVSTGRAVDRELELLQRIASLPFPFAAEDLGGIDWCWARRNRLGVWNRIGSIEPLDDERLDALLDLPEKDWIRCGDDALLMLEGLDGWSRGSRESVASLFAMRSEHYNLKRALEQDGSSIADAPPPDADGILGESPVIREMLASIARLARRDVAVCIEGESGTGKELAARAVHRGSRRRTAPFVAVNCAALPETLIESELFGHARGAFTGADRDRPGLIEAADRGTLFLDEIGEMPLAAQAKLLRFLQEGEVRRLGESVTRRADVRIVSATNRRLDAEVDAGRFREDLYYRIRGVEIRIPPLRDRGGDVLLLARHFLASQHARHGGAVRFTEEVEMVFLAHEWPGNVRELAQVVEAAHAVAGESRAVELDHLPPRLRIVRPVRRAAGNFFDEVNQFRRALLERSLAEAGGNQSRAAKMLGISRQALAYQIRELGIAVPARR